MRDEDWYEIGGHDESLYDLAYDEVRQDYEPEWMPELDSPSAAELGEDFPRAR
jgi:hypothetical protein